MNDRGQQEQYFTAVQLAGLPGMPIRAGHVPRFMGRLGIAGRAKQGQGGGREYPISALPAETRAALAARLVSTAPATLPADSRNSSPVSPRPAEQSAPGAAFSSEAARAGSHAARKVRLSEAITAEAAHNRRLSGLSESLHQPINGQRRIDAKLAILSIFDQFHKTSGLAIRVARPDFARRYNAGGIEVEAWVRDLVPEISDASLWRWSGTAKRSGIAALAGDYGNRRGEGKIDRQPELRDFLIGFLAEFPHTTVANMREGMNARFNGHSRLEYPSPRALERWLKNWKRENEQTFTALANPDAWKGRYMTAFGSQSEGIERVNQRWELDSTPGDIMLTDGRHVVIGVIDVYPRRARLLVSRTSKGAAIASLLRRSLLEWGVLEQARTDGGADYVGNHMVRVFRGLEVEHQVCTKFSPWEKPHIESFFKTFSHGLVELLPGFIGHNVAERKAIEDRKSFAERLMTPGAVVEVSMSSAEFQRFCDRWCDDVYMHNPHAGLKGKTPFEVLAAARDQVRTISDPRALDVLLAEAPANNGRRTVQKKGIELDHAWFIAPELGARVGDDVFVRFDPVDLGRIYVFDADEGYICTAECPERTGMDRREVAIKARELQKAHVQRERAAIKAAGRKARTDDIVTEILEQRAEQAGKLARLPGPRTAHASAGLAEAAKAAHGRTALPAGERISPDERAALDAELAGAASAPAPASRSRKVVAIDDPEINFRRWERIDAAIAAGSAVGDEDRAWHAAYRGSDEWRSTKAFFDDFPDLRREQG